MGLLEPFIEALDGLNLDDSQSLVDIGQLAPIAYWQAMLDRHRKIAKANEPEIAKIKAVGDQMLSDLEASAQATKQLPPGIDALIERLLRTETKHREGLLRPDDSITLPFPPNTPRTEKRRIIRIINKAKAAHEKVSKQYLANIRDVRWALIVLRAEYEDPGDAPIFDSSDDLESYLQAAISDGTNQD
jgi:hypothetical protein